MNTLMRWDPFKDLDEFQARLTNWFVPPRMKTNGGQKVMTEWAPLVDIVEDDKEYLIKADLPEIKKDDVHVMVHGNILEIKGEREQMKEEKDKKFHRMERAYGVFERSFTVPDDADAAKLAAEFKDGVLKVHLPKSDRARPRNIEVKVF